MSLKQMLFKPKWQHRDPLVRAAAVSSESDAGLMEALPEICLQDEDSEVRTAAIRRLHELPVLVRAESNPLNQPEKQLITDRIRTLTTSRGEDRPPLAERLAVIASSKDRTLLESAAVDGPETELRQAAIARLERQGVLGDVAIGDPDPGNRRLAAERIEQHSTLQRVIDGLRKSDKALRQDLQARMHSEQLAAGNVQALNREAESLCEALEALVMSRLSETEQQKEVIRLSKTWDSLGDSIDSGLVQRHEGLLARLQPKPPAAPPSSESKPEQEPDPPARLASAKESPVQKPPPKIEPEPDPQPAEDPAQQAKALVLERIESDIALLNKQAEDGELHLALETRARIVKAGKALTDERQRKGIQQQLARVQGRLKEMRGWLQWSNNKIRKRLIGEMQALPASGLHPDAVLERLKELQAQWKELERSEQIPGEKHFSSPQSMWRQFNAAGRTAFELTKPFLDKRSEMQQEFVDSVKALAQELRDITKAESPDWTALRQTLSRAGRKLRDMSSVPARSRKKVAGSLRKAMDGANARMQEHYQEVEKTKRRLIRQATQLAHMDDRDEAIATAKSLQADWKSAGSLWRSLDQKLWKAFREPIEPLFDQLSSEHEAAQEQREQDLAAQRALCDELKSLLALEDAELATHRGKVQGLSEAWQDIPKASAGLRKQFQKHQSDFEQRLRRHRTNVANLARERWWDKSALLHQLELAIAGGKAAPKAVASNWPAGAEQSSDLDGLLDARRDQALQPGAGDELKPSDETAEQARMLCIRLEFLAGLTSPEADKDLRMRYQVDRLSASMSGDEERLPAQEEARLAEQDWLLMPLLPARKYQSYRNRVKAALDEINRE